MRNIMVRYSLSNTSVYLEGFQYYIGLAIQIQKMNTTDIGSPPSKLKLLNERWQQIQHEIDRQKHYRSHSLDEQLHHLADKLNSNKLFSQQKVQLLTQKIEKIKEDLRQVQEHKEELNSAGEKKLAKIEETIQAEIDNEKKIRVQHTNGWIKKSDEKLLDICNSMENITSEKGQTVDNLALRIKKKLADLEATIEAERKRREEETAKITQTIEDQLNKMYLDLERQRRAREQNARKIETMLREIQTKLEAEVEEERKLRKQTNSSLLFLLEQTCMKVQKAFE